MGDFMGETNCQQYMTGIQRSGSTCGPGRSAYAFQIQHQQQGFPFDTFKTQVDIAGKPFYTVAVEAGPFDFQRAFNKSIPHGGQPLRSFWLPGA